MQRWNFIKRDKCKRSHKRPWLQLAGYDDDLLGVQRPAFPVGGYYMHPLHDPAAAPPGDGGPCEVQMVRSSADWSHGLAKPERSVQTAYKDIIENAQRFVYIENQFFITSTADEGEGNAQQPVYNTIGRAIVNAVVRAHREERKFRVIIVIPAIPGFPGDLRDDSAMGTRAIIDYQYKSISRGEHSIFGQLRRHGIDPTAYVFVFNLRIYDRIHVTHALLDRQRQTGVGYPELQAAHARQVLGRPGAAGATGAKNNDSSSSPVVSGGSRLEQRRREFERGMQPSPLVSDSVAGAAMEGSRPLTDEPWDNGADRERMDFVQEELYVHSKLLIVDDETMVCGSANINDRSQLGDHDSELAAVVRHGPTVASLRKQLWMEHLGLLPGQSLDAADNPNAQPPGLHSPNRCGAGRGREDGDGVDPLVEDDALSDALWQRWTAQATTNTNIYHRLFHTDPDNSSMPLYRVLCGCSCEVLTRGDSKNMGRLRRFLPEA